MHRTEDGAIVGSINVAELTEEERRELGLATPEDETAEDETEDLSKLYKSELVERAQAVGLDVEGLSKAEIVELLEAAEGDGT
jgi:hypothetical protein